VTSDRRRIAAPRAARKGSAFARCAPVYVAPILRDCAGHDTTFLAAHTSWRFVPFTAVRAAETFIPSVGAAAVGEKQRQSSIHDFFSALAATVGPAVEEIGHRVQVAYPPDDVRESAYRPRSIAVRPGQTLGMTDRDVIGNAPAGFAEDVFMLPALVERPVDDLLLDDVGHNIQETHETPPPGEMAELFYHQYVVKNPADLFGEV
jgi:hypothetical protein